MLSYYHIWLPGLSVLVYLVYQFCLLVWGVGSICIAYNANSCMKWYNDPEKDFFTNIYIYFLDRFLGGDLKSRQMIADGDVKPYRRWMVI